jgi:hypothetical protein
MSNSHLFLLGMAGAACLEIFKLYEYKAKLAEKKYQKLMRSIPFWGVVAAMLCASGFIAWVFNSQIPNIPPLPVVCTGIAARSIVREAAAVGVARSGTKLGDEVSLRDIFL